MEGTASVLGTRSRWAGNGLNGDPVVDLSGFQSGLPIRLIATERAALSTCRRDEDIAAVVERNREDQFDYCPVTTDGQIVALIELAPFMQGDEPAVGKVGDRAAPLAEANLIGADASILSFVRDADRQRCRLVVSQHTISGLVSLSDLQRLPVRAALFAMVTYFEMTMADAIRREFRNSASWTKRLKDERRAKVLEEIEKSRQEDAYVDTLLFTQFADKVTIIKRSASFEWSKSEFKSVMHKVEELRNALAHANDYAATLQQAVETCEVVRAMDVWIARLAGWAPTPVTSTGSEV